MIDSIPDIIRWMYWTYPSAIFIGAIFAAIIGLSAWDTVSPGQPRKGFLPIRTTRGDRFFIGVISFLLIHLLWLAIFQTAFLWIASVIAICWFIVLGLKG